MSDCPLRVKAERSIDITGFCLRCQAARRNQVHRANACFGGKLLPFNERLKTREGSVPLPGYEIEIGPEIHHCVRMKRKPILAAGSDAAHNSGILQHAQVLGDCLAAHAVATSELRNRARLAAAELSDQRQASLIAQGGKDRSVGAALCGYAARVFV